MPTPNASPASEIILSVTPEKYISAIANITLIGMDAATMSVGLILLKNMSSTITASTAPMSRLFMTVVIIISIYIP